MSGARAGVQALLCMNAGSSSLKLALFEAQGEGAEAARPRGLLRGALEGVGAEQGRLVLREAGGRVRVDRPARAASLAAAAHTALEALDAAAPLRVAAVAHRMVHGGPGFQAPRLVDRALRARLREAALRAPLHLPGALEVLDATQEHLEGAPHVACFDGAFHAELPDEARRLALPEALDAEGVRRVGFHGLSFASVVAQLGSALAPRSVIAHLGSGASLVALDRGRPVDTTMGLTPAGGVVMATRSGDLDPGVLVHLMRTHGWDAARLESLVNRESGLLGLSGSSGDVRQLCQRRGRDPRADLALRVWVRSVRKAVGALAAVLGGLDLLVFTGGVGERAPELRREICAGLVHLGVDPAAPERGACAVRVVATDEEQMMAEQLAAWRAERMP